MNPEQRLLVVHKYLTVEFLVFFIGTFAWIFGPEWIGIIEWNRTFYDFEFILSRGDFNDFLFTILVFFFLGFCFLVDFFNDRVRVKLVFLVNSFVFFRCICFG